jgi:DNA-binding transcriptional ArsR family regulator
VDPAAAAACLDALDGAFLRALAEPARVAILRQIVTLGRADVGTIASGLPHDRSVTTRHLHVLKEAGLVRATAEGRHTFYEIDGERTLLQLEELTTLLKALRATCCPPSRVSPATQRAPTGTRATPAKKLKSEQTKGNRQR